MRKIFTAIFFFLPVLCLGQQNQPKYYLNGIEFFWDSVFIAPNSIKSIIVKHDLPNGALFIETNEEPWKYKTLLELLKTIYSYDKIKDPSIIPVFIVEGKVVNNPSVIKIDNTYYANAILKSISNVTGISVDCKKIVLVDVKLADDPKKFIRIRGENNQYLDSILKTIK